MSIARYPQKMGVENCRDYLRTGKCKYGESCKYNHPPNVECGGGIKSPNPGEPLFPIRPSEPPCKYFLKHGTCKFGQTCKFHHPPDLLELLPQRPSEPECLYFLRNGKCKYGAACKFHHPLPLKRFKQHTDATVPVQIVNNVATTLIIPNQISYVPNSAPVHLLVAEAPSVALMLNSAVPSFCPLADMYSNNHLSFNQTANWNNIPDNAKQSAVQQQHLTIPKKTLSELSQSNNRRASSSSSLESSYFHWAEGEYNTNYTQSTASSTPTSSSYNFSLSSPRDSIHHSRKESLDIEGLSNMTSTLLNILDNSDDETTIDPHHARCPNTSLIQHSDIMSPDTNENQLKPAFPSLDPFDLNSKVINRNESTHFLRSQIAKYRL